MPDLKLYLDREQVTVGRAPDCDVCLPENVRGIDVVSRQHARIVRRGGRWAILDGRENGELSTNGVYVNGKRTLECYLSDNDQIGLGDVMFRFHLPPGNGEPGRGPQ